ncbi:single-stranded DNA-binding protein [Lysinibacillus sp. NPDC048646]|uniref:single-stranded DNA-binding protein n=1 Tax=Lysinibacillus sp. NPDC048646 TaxID=3390574 RepID=UPI003CFBE215
MINRVVLVGRLTKDPELRYTPNGIASTRFTVAVNRTFSNQQGEKEADFISCVAWRKQAENLANFMKKGSLIGVEGRIQTGSYEGQDGKRVYTTDVVADSVQFLEPRSGGGAPASNQYGGQSYANSQPSYGGGQPQQQFGGAMPQQGSFGGDSYQQNQPPMNQPNYTRVDEDPFANSKGPIEVSEDDLPF